MPSLSVIVPATDRPPTLEVCLAALRAAEAPPEEILVVTSEPRGAGPAAARNEAARRATGDVLVFVDSDVAVRRDALVRMRAAFGERPELDAVFGSYDQCPPAPGLVSRFRNLLHHHVHQASPGSARTFWAGLGAIRREVFLAASGFDSERFGPPCVEDVELGLRLSDAGRHTELDPDLLGTHLKGWTLASMVQTDLTGRALPWIGVLLRRRSVPPVLNLRWVHRFSALASLLALLGALARRPAASIGSLAVLGVLNRSFYALLVRRLGPARAPLGVALHLVHHLTAVAAVPIGVVTYAAGLEQRRERTTLISVRVERRRRERHRWSSNGSSVADELPVRQGGEVPLAAAGEVGRPELA